MTDDLPLSPVTPADELDFLRAVGRHFYEESDDTELAVWKGVFDLDRAVAVRDAGRIVANIAALPADISVPGGARLGCAAITAAGVAHTHRRRGLLTRMMDHCFDQAVERDEPVAALYASESPIYPRFGFGVSATQWDYEIDVQRLRFTDPVASSLVVEATPDEAAASFPKIFDEVRGRRPGGVARTAGQWRLHLQVDLSSWRDGASARRLVHVPGRGFATYRVKSEWRGNLPAGEVRAQVVAADPEAEQALWQHVTSVDLTTTCKMEFRPDDDVLPWVVEDRLRLGVREGAPLYTRILDVDGCLSARTAAVDDALVLGVHDGTRDQAGTFRWEASPGGSACQRVDAEPDVSLSIGALSALWLGGVRASRLRTAGWVTEETAGAVARLDRMLVTDLAPWTPWEF